MTLFCHLSFLILNLFFNVESVKVQTDLHKIAQVRKLYQTTFFISANYTDAHTFLASEIPNEIYSFGMDNKILYENSSENVLKNMYSLQESIIILYTSNLEEFKPFVDFLIPKLSVRKRPKCLIAYSRNFQHANEMALIDTLKYAWKKKFLDFSFISTPSSSVYYFNPFCSIVYLKKLNDEVEIFPDKLLNLNGHPFYIPNLKHLNNSLFLQSHRKVNINSKFDITFVAKVLNQSLVVKRNLTHPPTSLNHMESHGLDMHTYWPIRYDYLSNYSVSSEVELENFVAIVPVIPLPRSDISFKIYYVFPLTSPIVFFLLYLFNRFQAISRHIRTFDIVQILLSQPIKCLPQKMAHRMIFVTAIIVSVKIMNDFLANTFIMQFEQEEIPFNTHKDLWNSQLQPYTDSYTVKEIKPNDEYLTRIIDRTRIVDNIVDCIETLNNWKNVTCITYEFLAKIYQAKFPDAMKVAKTPVFTVNGRFYVFAKASPYAMKFLEVIRRAREADLMYWEVLVDPCSVFWNFEKETRGAHGKAINSRQLLIILWFGFFVSGVIFIIELIKFNCKKIINYCLSN